jgi:phage I-like protein
VRSIVRLSVDTPLSDDPPTEFRIFRAGLNPSSKGDFMFDEAAALRVMTAFQRWGVDRLMIDLNHDSLADDSASARADAGDARGWFVPELRGGELWATQVTWTADGERRIRERLQRYISPAFFEENGRVEELLNVAIVAMPACHQALALIAASRKWAGLAPRERGAIYLSRVRQQSRKTNGS